MLCSPAGQHHTRTHISALIDTKHTLSNLTGWSACLGELIVFRWGYLRRGSGREDMSKGLREKRRKAEGYKLTMCRIFSFHMGFGEKTADTLSLFFCLWVPLNRATHTHTHFSPKCIVMHFLKCPVVHLVKFQWYPPLRATLQNKPLNKLEVMETAGQALQQYHYHTHTHTHAHTIPLSGQYLLVPMLTEFVHKWP